MKKTIIGIAVMLLGLSACKTTEANYRAAYDKTIAAREAQDDDDDNIYGGIQRRMSSTYVLDGRDSVAVSVKHVSLVTDADQSKAEMKKYNLIGGQFKQRFNAMSLSRRYADAGWPDAFVVQTAEPYYYIVVGTYDTISEARQAEAKLKSDSPVELHQPLPFILIDPRSL